LPMTGLQHVATVPGFRSVSPVSRWGWSGWRTAGDGAVAVVQWVCELALEVEALLVELLARETAVHERLTDPGGQSG
jgi:hypothetical protein